MCSGWSELSWVLNIIIIVIIGVVSKVHRPMHLVIHWFLFADWHDLAHPSFVTGRQGNSLFLYWVLYLPVHFGFLNLSIVNPVDGWPPHGTLVGKSEFLGEVLDISCVSDTCKWKDLFVTGLLQLHQRLLFVQRSLLTTILIGTRNGHRRHRSGLPGDINILLRSFRGHDVWHSGLLLSASHSWWHHFTSYAQTLS
mgnify:CR=1 FL=1